MDKINVLVTLSFSEEQIAKLSSISPRLSVMMEPVKMQADMDDIIADVDILYTTRILPDFVRSKNLKWVQLHSAGVDQVVHSNLYTKSEIRFTTTNGIHAVNMGEYVLGQMLAFSHRLPEMIVDQAEKRWHEKKWSRFLPDELHGATVGIIGYGSIGRQVARLCKAFGMTVLAVKRDIRQMEDTSFQFPDIGDPTGDIPDRFYPPEALKTCLSVCDYVILIVPLTDATHNLIDAEMLDAMKETAVLINVARGGVVDEEALAEALTSGKIRGAALDVYKTEPLPESSPLWELSNVILSPHIAGATPYYNDRAIAIFSENLRRFISGETLINLVDRKHHY